MMRSLTRHSLLCFRTKDLYFTHRPFFTVRTNPPSKGIINVVIKVRFGTRFNFRSMSSSVSSSSRTAEQVVAENEAQQIDKLLTATNDDHGGVIVEMTTEPMDASVFVSLLRASISHWTRQGKKGVWIKLPIELVNLVEPAVKEGFYYHHAEPKYLMLVHWIPETANTLPANATHRVGIGAFVMNEKREGKGSLLACFCCKHALEVGSTVLPKLSFSLPPQCWVRKKQLRKFSKRQVLVVQEKSGKFRGTGVWKFPTGVVDEGEDICDAAVREVKEETGIDTNFVEILAFRQSHREFFEKSDLFFMCMLQALSFDIQKQESEIEAAQWMPFEEYAAQPFVQKHELLRYIVDTCLAKIEREYSGFSPVPITSSFSDTGSYLYLNRQDLNSH